VLEPTGVAAVEVSAEVGVSASELDAEGKSEMSFVRGDGDISICSS
jgi:hypothetical protein